MYRSKDKFLAVLALIIQFIMLILNSQIGNFNIYAIGSMIFAILGIVTVLIWLWIIKHMEN